MLGLCVIDRGTGASGEGCETKTECEATASCQVLSFARVIVTALAPHVAVTGQEA
jgi:hypothetical protein